MNDDDVKNRIEQLELMLHRCHAAIKSDDNERIANGEAPRWSCLDKEVEMTLQHYAPEVIADVIKRKG